MNEETHRSEAGSEIVEALTGFLEAVEAGGALSNRFTVRAVHLDLKPRSFVGEDVQRTRELLGLSQPLFARFLGVGVTAIRAWEGGEREVSGIANRFLDEVATNPDYWKGRIRDLMGARDTPNLGLDRQPG